MGDGQIQGRIVDCLEGVLVAAVSIRMLFPFYCLTWHFLPSANVKEHFLLISHWPLHYDWLCGCTLQYSMQCVVQGIGKRLSTYIN